MVQPHDQPVPPLTFDEVSPNTLILRIHQVRYLIFRYWWVVVLTVGIGMAIQGYLASQRPTRYVSNSRMIVNGQVNIGVTAFYSEEYSQFFGTQVAIMRSPQTYEEAVERVRALHPEITPDDSASVEANQEPKTSIFNLSVSSVNPAYAQALLTAVMDTYLERKRSRREQNTNETVSALTEEISRLDNEIRDDEQKLVEFQKDNNVVFIEEQSSSAALYLVNLNNELARLTKEHDLLELEGDVVPTLGAESAGAGDATTAAQSSTDTDVINKANASVAAEQETIDKLKILRADYGTYLKDQHPKMIELDDEIQKEEAFLDVLKSKSVDARKAHRDFLLLQIQNLQKQITEQNAKSLDLNQRLGTYNELKNKITREENLYAQLAASFQNVDLNKSIGQEDVVVMEPAAQAYSVAVNYPVQLGLGALGGLFVAAVLIFLLSRLSDPVISPLQLQERIDYPIIAQVTVARQQKTKTGPRVPLLVERDKRHMLIEAYRNIRSSILFSSATATSPRSLLVSSAAPGEGKSTLASNLAITFAFAGARTLLIDADLRRGILHELFNLPASPASPKRCGTRWRGATRCSPPIFPIST